MATALVRDLQLSAVLRQFQDTKTQLVDLLIKATTSLEKLLEDESVSVVLGELDVPAHLDQCRSASGSLETIRQDLERKEMKIVVFGRTSSGKSALLNSILGKRILPSEWGHTTNCFIEIRGAKMEKSVLRKGDGEEISVEKIEKIADAVRVQNLATVNETADNSVLSLLLPEERCRLLKQGIVLLDTPGFDVNQSMDSQIARHGSDCDIFVMMISSESTISESEKKFVEQLIKRLPDCQSRLFIIFNKWDEAVKHAEKERKDIGPLRLQHRKRAEDLVKNLPSERDTVYFLSAETAVDARTSPTQVEDTHGLVKEFEAFERELMASTSAEAIQRKLAAQVAGIEKVLNDSLDILHNITNHARKLEEELTKDLNSRKALRKKIQEEISYIMDETDDDSLMKMLSPLWNEYVKKVEEYVSGRTIRNKQEFYETFLNAMKDVYLYSKLRQKVLDVYKNVTFTISKKTVEISSQKSVSKSSAHPKGALFEIPKLSEKHFFRGEPNIDFVGKGTSFSSRYLENMLKDLTLKAKSHEEPDTMGIINMIFGITYQANSHVMTYVCVSAAVAGNVAGAIITGGVSVAGMLMSVVAYRIGWCEYIKPKILAHKNRKFTRKMLAASTPHLLREIIFMLQEELSDFVEAQQKYVEDCFRLREMNDAIKTLQQQVRLQNTRQELEKCKENLKRIIQVVHENSPQITGDLRCQV